jgi:hypothetical protein
MAGFYTADGDMKPPKPLGPLSKAGRASQIQVSDGFSNDHFTSTNMRSNHQLATSSMVVKKRIPPNKNRSSEPGVPWSSNDHPARDTFTTSNELRTEVAATTAVPPRRKPAEGAKSTVKLGGWTNCFTSLFPPGGQICRAAFGMTKFSPRLGYKEAEGKDPYTTMVMQQFQDPLLGLRKAGPTARAPPVRNCPASPPPGVELTSLCDVTPDVPCATSCDQPNHVRRYSSSYCRRRRSQP